MIEIKDISKSYNETKALENISLEVKQNELFGLIGPDGAGKTTLMRILTTLLLPETGTATLNNLDAVKDYKKIRHIIGYMPGRFSLYQDLSVEENLNFFASVFGTTVEENYDLIKDIYYQIEPFKTRRAGKLSGGMKRRLNICLALIHNPEILILDEPEAGLDPQSRILVRDFIKAYGKEKTIILTTHNMDEADRLADRIAIIDYGKLLLLDTPQNLKKTIGEGDILEIVIENGDEEKINLFAEKIALSTKNAKTVANRIFIKYPNVIDKLPSIKNMAESDGFLISEIKLRENTLEDVFIHLTGRNLRQ
jgi:ABC-2 type transport system ATP-binding protein